MRIAKLLVLSALAACAERPVAPRTDISTASPAFQRTAEPDNFHAVEVRSRRLPPTQNERALIEAAVAGLPQATAATVRAALLDSTGTDRVRVSGSPELSAAIAKVYEERRRSNPRPARRALIPVTIALVPELAYEHATADIIRRPGLSSDWDIPAAVFDASATVRALQSATARSLDGRGTVKAVVVNLPVVKFRKHD